MFLPPCYFSPFNLPVFAPQRHILPLYPTGSASAAAAAAAATLQQSGRMIKKVSHNPSSFSSLPPIFTRASFTFYAKLSRALCTISSFSSLIPTLVHALMTLKAKGCFFLGTIQVSRLPMQWRRALLFPPSAPDHFCLPILWLLGSRARADQGVGGR